MHLSYFLVSATLSLLTRAAGPSNSTAGSGPEKYVRIILQNLDPVKSAEGIEPIEARVIPSETSNDLARRFSDSPQPLSSAHTRLEDSVELKKLKRAIAARLEVVPETSTFVGRVEFGSGDFPQTLKVVFDTSLHESWAAGSESRDSSLHGHTLYDPVPSSTNFYHREIACSPRYVLGTVRGRVLIENLVLEVNEDGHRLIADDVEICLADSVSSNYAIETFKADGALGLAPLFPGDPEDSQPPSILRIIAQKLDQAVISFDLRWIKGHSTQSEILFGMIDYDRLRGAVNYITVPERPGHRPRWAMTIRSFSVKVDANAQPTALDSPFLAIIESGSRFISLPRAMAVALFASVEDKHEHSEVIGGHTSLMYAVRCDVDLPIIIETVTDNVKFNLNLKNLAMYPIDPGSSWCLSGIAGTTQLTDRMLLGEVFIAQQYTVLEFIPGRMPRLGFAPRVEDGPLNEERT